MSKLLKFPYLHCLVYIIADKPVKENISQDVPLVGTDSYRKLLEWLGLMDIDITRVRLYNQSDKPFDTTMGRVTLNQAIELNQIRVIALGQKAASYLMKAGVKQHFLLPHPSGKNRLLNDKEFVKLKLAACRNYIYKGVLDERESPEQSDGVDESGYLSDV